MVTTKEDAQINKTIVYSKGKAQESEKSKLYDATEEKEQQHLYTASGHKHPLKKLLQINFRRSAQHRVPHEIGKRWSSSTEPGGETGEGEGSNPNCNFSNHVGTLDCSIYLILVVHYSAQSECKFTTKELAATYKISLLNEVLSRLEVLRAIGDILKSSFLRLEVLRAIGDILKSPFLR
ncbi:hypothetical protein ACJX0J_006067, partial [Zea mays]